MTRGPAGPGRHDADGAMFSEAEFARRRHDAVSAVREYQLDALVISSHEHLTYLTGYEPPDLTAPFLLTLTRDEQPRLHAAPELLPWGSADLTSPLGAWRARIAEVEESGRVGLAAAAARTLRRELGGRGGAGARARIGFEGGWHGLSWSRQAQLQQLVEATWVEATHILTAERLRKSDEEIAVMARAAAVADRAMEATVSGITAGAREKDAALRGYDALAAAGSEYPSFPALLGTGPRSGLYHPLPTERVITPGDAVEIEMTAVFARYNSNIVRTVFVPPVAREQRQAWDCVRAAFDAALRQMRPGQTAGAVDDASRAARAPYARHIPSRTGYSVGLSYPPFLMQPLSLLTGEPARLEPGMVFSLEPSVAGARGETVILGCNVLVTENEPRVLNAFTREMLIR
jgi:Xaa-Pro aminopeptidase